MRTRFCRVIVGEQLRPVIILGPFAEALMQKLISESPDKYKAYEGEHLKTTTQDIERGMEEGVFIAYKKVNDLFMVYKTDAIHEIASQVCFIYLNVSVVCVMIESLFYDAYVVVFSYGRFMTSFTGLKLSHNPSVVVYFMVIPRLSFTVEDFITL